MPSFIEIHGKIYQKELIKSIVPIEEVKDTGVEDFENGGNKTVETPIISITFTDSTGASIRFNTIEERDRVMNYIRENI